MHNTQLISLLKTFSVYEINSFQKFVHSPYFNKSDKVIKLFNLLEGTHPGYDDPCLEKKVVYKKIFGGNKYDDKQMRYLSYETLKLAEEFLGISRYRKDKSLAPAFDILTELGSRGQKKLFERRFNYTSKALEMNQYPIPEFFFNKWKLIDIQNFYKYYIYSKTRDPKLLVEQSESLILFMLTNLAYLLYNISITQHAENTSSDSVIMREFIKNLNLDGIVAGAKKTGHQYASLLEIYNCLIKMIYSEDDETYFFRLKEIMNEPHPFFTVTDMHNFYANLTAYCTKQNLKGKREYINEMFEIHKKQLASDGGFMESTNYMSSIIYYNILLVGLYLKEFNWVEDFIRGNIEKLIPEDQDNFLNFSYASLNFEKGNNEKSLQFVSKVRIEHFYFKYEIRLLMLKAHYELGHIEQTLSLIDSSKHFLKKNKSVTDERGIPFLNFLNFIAEMVKYRIDAKGADPARLREGITNEKVLLNKKWLLEKAEEFMNDN